MTYKCANQNRTTIDCVPINLFWSFSISLCIIFGHIYLLFYESQKRRKQIRRIHNKIANFSVTAQFVYLRNNDSSLWNWMNETEGKIHTKWNKMNRRKLRHKSWDVKRNERRFLSVARTSLIVSLALFFLVQLVRLYLSRLNKSYLKIYDKKKRHKWIRE